MTGGGGVFGATSRRAVDGVRHGGSARTGLVLGGAVDQGRGRSRAERASPRARRTGRRSRFAAPGRATTWGTGCSGRRSRPRVRKAHRRGRRRGAPVSPLARSPLSVALLPAVAAVRLLVPLGVLIAQIFGATAHRRAASLALSSHPATGVPQRGLQSGHPSTRES